ncbi:YbaK/EbsC family protein [Tardiphaga sp. 1201_B9_N1_1]|jgi:prolyl-tRNA editing enzyme YbaK/EbsC (Cys-tRNA(Pro) deacylase)|uniref:YbaK/EbsC family protein n=1 Tax=Tardiphaga robiniae TaxID=943830 RepID=A0A7G6U2I3_9BRAD|nr:YbaK/EbsC family protein [Tardiphaga robiniae]MDR6658901.1 prolyl-tRNA editing enzyme YbaK/EbsC (Cys-tRNA(Pro) deacylase) [Tardiphaga robiniae]NUU42770.1 YbaK/EbsC family protein [Tardiphaga robiniae]QND73215.1 YbaK/EbsC family protein [Tardiphaga robiniae]
MSLESVRAFLTANAPELSVTVTDKSSATVLLAAEALGVEPGQIAKTLSVRVGDRVVLVVTKGTARLDNKKARDALGGKPRMLGADEVVALTGHPVGGVCPFGLATPLQVYCDVSLKEFAEVWPAAGSVNSSVRMSPARMAELTGASWVDVCQEPAAVQEQAPAMG